MKSLSLIVPVLNGAALIGNCLRSLEAQCLPGDEIIVVDNGSSDGTPDLVAREFPNVRLMPQRQNLGFAGGINRGVEAARGDVFVLVNHDITLFDGCLMAMLQRLDTSGPGIVGCKLLYPDGHTLQHAGGLVHYPRGESEHRGHHQPDDGRWDEAGPADYVTGALIAFDRAVLRTIGLFDEAYYPIYYEEVDYCFRARAAGFPVIYDPTAVAIHHESQWQSPRGEVYHQTAQNGRLRFVLKNYRSEQFLEDFVPAEREYLQSLPPYALMDRRVMAQAYFNALVSLPDIRLGDGPLPAGRKERWSDDAMRQLEVALVDLQLTALHSAGHAASLDEMPWEVVEKPFVSRLPFVARVREVWNSVSTKWFVRAILQQQNRYNRRAAEQMIETGDRVLMQNREMQSLARKLNEAQRQIEQLEKRLTIMERSGKPDAELDMRQTRRELR